MEVRVENFSPVTKAAGGDALATVRAGVLLAEALPAENTTKKR